MNLNTPQLREQCAQRLLAAKDQVRNLTAFVGLDGFVDEIIHVVDARQSAEAFQKISTMPRLAERISAAAGKSTNIELVTELTKLGGNGPIMANALASFGLKVTYLGALGYPNMHPVFQDFAKRAEVHTVAEAGHTDALEFDDGKLMFGKMVQLNEVTWENIQARFGRDRFATKFADSDLVAFVNWTMLPYMSDLWDALLQEICPTLTGPRRKLFFDLADPAKRTANDISRALELVTRFEKYFDVILGLNEKEGTEISQVLGFAPKPQNPESICALAREMRRALPVSTILIHPVRYAVATSDADVFMVEGPHLEKPLIATGAGDHFNSGFCLGKLLRLDSAMCLLTGVATSGYYVRTGQSPSVLQLAEMLQHWPAQ
jgi:sugar/nucleoside kinase (ribokinase family)